MKKKVIFKQRIIEKDPVKEKEKTELVNKTLIDIRKYYLKNINDNKSLKFKLLHFNKVIKNTTPEKSSEFIDTFIKHEEWGFDAKK
jgi:hypothetical protein